MSNSFFLQPIHKTSNVDANLKSRQYKLNLMSDFMRMKYENPKLEQSEKPNQFCCSSSTLQRYKNDKKMLLPYRIQSNNTNKRAKRASNTNFNNDSHREPDVKRLQMTSDDLETNQTNRKSYRKHKNFLKAESIQENIEINDQYLDENLDNNDV